ILTCWLAALIPGFGVRVVAGFGLRLFFPDGAARTLAAPAPPHAVVLFC
ncbi:hypothetical protein LCGC14_0788340, partial [marine sediment metagenome]